MFIDQYAHEPSSGHLVFFIFVTLILIQVIEAMHDNLRGGANFQVVAKRRFAYFIISVYLPSLSLWAVTHFTNFISVDHFEANIMVHLTAMLVMYTLFQATSISLPTVMYSNWHVLLLHET